MDQTNIPGFEVIGPKRIGMLDQSVVVGWKWNSPIGLLGHVFQLRGAGDDTGADMTARCLRYGRKWHRRMVLSPEHHLWMTVWRLKGQIQGLRWAADQQKADRDTWFIDTRQFASWFHVLVLRLMFAYVRPPSEADGPELDDD